MIQTQTREAGMNDFVQKPVRFASLQNIITQISKENKKNN
jgi:FixJ family two-component response regulator